MHAHSKQRKCNNNHNRNVGKLKFALSSLRFDLFCFYFISVLYTVVLFNFIHVNFAGVIVFVIAFIFVYVRFVYIPFHSVSSNQTK